MKLSFLFFLCTIFTATACAQDAWIKNDDDAAVRAAAITSQYQLTPIKTECLYFDTADEGMDWLVRVREKHSQACGGDLETTPTVFFLKLRKRDGHATTNAYNYRGKFEELKAVPEKNARSVH